MDQKTQAILEKIDEWQQLGYEAWGKSRRPQARESWRIAWGMVVELIQSGQFATIEDLDKVYHGLQSIANWISDYGEALYLAGLVKPADLPASIDFNRQVLAWSKKTDNLNSFNRRRMIAEGTFKSSGTEAGDAVYSEYTGEYPRWGWGWASWADQHDPARAEQILRQALLVPDLENRDVVQLRLREALVHQGRSIEASDIEVIGGRESGNKHKKWFAR